MKLFASLRTRLYVALVAVFALGVAGSMVYSHLEDQEVRDEIDQAKTGGFAREEVALRSLDEFDYEYLTFVFLPFALFAGVTIVWITIWSLRPILKAGHSLAGLEPGQSRGRLELNSLPKEVWPFAQSVNAALDRLSEAYESEKRFTTNAAHELRTPVAVLALRLQKARLDGDADWPAVERNVRQLTRVVSQLLDLASKESAEARSGPREVVNLGRMVREVAAMLLPMAEERGRNIEVDAPDAAQVHCHASDVADMLRNLLENALVHGTGMVTVRVVVNGEGTLPHVDLLIADEGPGVPPAIRDAVFERFRKGEAGSSGAGLGLSIVREVARAHRGQVEFLPTEQCQVRVRLPLASPADIPD